MPDISFDELHDKYRLLTEFVYGMSGCKYILNSPYGDLVRKICELYDYNNDVLYRDIKSSLGERNKVERNRLDQIFNYVLHNDMLANMISNCIRSDLIIIYDYDIFEEFISRKLEEYKDIPEVVELFREYYCVPMLVGDINQLSMIIAMNSDFTNKDEWPWNKDSMLTVKNRLANFRFSANKMKKLRFLGQEYFNGVRLKEAVKIDLLRQLNDEEYKIITQGE